MKLDLGAHVDFWGGNAGGADLTCSLWESTRQNMELSCADHVRKELRGSLWPSIGGSLRDRLSDSLGGP